ncbi:MAG: hypothetical protein JNM57_04240 [Cyclobacteriaceae bacterium]|nr:hypothetical protein [Cyclobacteriaceae bacterium]
MKNLILTLTFLSCSLFVLAQDNDLEFKLPKTFIKLSPLQFALNTLELGIETFNPTYSKSFNLSAGLRSGSIAYDEGAGGSLEISFRKYAAPMKFRQRGNRMSYQGIYYSFFLRGEYFKGENTDYYYGSDPSKYTEKTLSLTPGFTIGYQKTLWQILLLDVYVGGGVKFTDIEYPDGQPVYEPYYDVFDPGYSGIYPKIGAKIGIGL